MASAATQGLKRRRADVSSAYYAGHLVTKRSRAATPLPVDVSMFLRSDGANDVRVEARIRALDAMGLSSVQVIAQMARLVGPASLTLVDLNVYAPNIAAVLKDFAVVDLNMRSHAFCMGDKNVVASSFINNNKSHTFTCELLKFVITSVFAQENSVSVRVLSGGGVRDVLLADWCRTYKFCTDPAVNATPNIVIVTAESGRSFIIPFAA